ncbi:MAG: putative formaldehyde dehydrogenase AdhA [Actinomycetota bacterium]|jgi:uncharacterized zinc-type alcohol dehydrogenase-like protein
MTYSVKALAVSSPTSNFTEIEIDRRALNANDVLIDIEYAGICHSDIHQARNEWFEGIFPMVPGHEIAGVIREVGTDVTKFKVGDRVGVGVMVDSCGECEYCLVGRENVCLAGNVPTYNGRDKDGSPTYGGYSQSIVVKENYVLNIPASLNLDVAAPLLCAGVTVYLPLRNWGVMAGKKVAIYGLGGLGHLAVKIAVAMGAEVFVLGRSLAKKPDAVNFGATDYFNVSDAEVWGNLKNKFDLILNTTSANLDLDEVLSWLRIDGALVNVGLPGKPESFDPFTIIGGFKAIAGSNTGGIPETQEMLDFCASHGIGADIELIAPESAVVDAAYDRVVNSDVKYRFVIEMNKLS